MIRGLMVLGLLLLAQSAAADDLKSDVRRLVRQLDAPQLADREAAEAELLRRGPAVLDLLPSADVRTSAEVQERLRRIRQRLQQAAANAVAQSSTVTLHADALPLSKILAAIQEQSGNAIVDNRRKFGQPEGEPKLSVQFDRTPFWPALDQVLDQAGLTVYSYAGQRAISVVATPGAKRVGRACYSGPFRLEPLSVVARRNLREADDGTLAVALEVAWEPRLKIISLVQWMADVRAVDEHGNPLPVADPEAKLEAVTDGANPAVNWELPLRLPSRDVRQIARLTGKLHATIAGKIETFRFQNLVDAKRPQQRIAGVTVTLEQVRKSSEAWEVLVRVRFDDAGDSLASHRQWIFDNEAYLEAPDGKPIAYDALETTAQGNSEVGLAYRFHTDRPPAQLTFVYKTPAAIITRTFDYELKDIRMP